MLKTAPSQPFRQPHKRRERSRPGKVHHADYCSSSSRALRMSALALRPYLAARRI